MIFWNTDYAFTDVTSIRLEIKYLYVGAGDDMVVILKDEFKIICEHCVWRYHECLRNWK